MWYLNTYSGESAVANMNLYILQFYNDHRVGISHDIECCSTCCCQTFSAGHCKVLIIIIIMTYIYTTTRSRRSVIFKLLSRYMFIKTMAQ